MSITKKLKESLILWVEITTKHCSAARVTLLSRVNLLSPTLGKGP
jgi:hypothetical protein